RAEKAESRAVKSVRARLGNPVYHPARATPIFCFWVMSDDFEFLDRLQRERDVLAAHKDVGVVGAVNRHVKIAAALAIDTDRGAIAVRGIKILVHCLIARRRAWNQRGQSGKVATIDGQRLHLLGSHRFVERGSVGFNGGSQALNRHTLLAAGWRKR